VGGGSYKADLSPRHIAKEQSIVSIFGTGVPNIETILAKGFSPQQQLQHFANQPYKQRGSQL
jgi:hypothetical protein